MKALKLLVLIGYATLLFGCNTMDGLGKDLRILGDKISGKAEEAKK